MSQDHLICNDPLYRLTYACTEWDEIGETCLGDECSYTYDAVERITSR